MTDAERPPLEGVFAWTQQVDEVQERLGTSIVEPIREAKREVVAICPMGLDESKCHLKARFERSKRIGRFTCVSESSIKVGESVRVRKTPVPCNGPVLASEIFKAKTSEVQLKKQLREYIDESQSGPEQDLS